MKIVVLVMLTCLQTIIAKDFQVIYINGPSSSGKSTLIKAIQEEMEPFYLHIGIDRMIAMMPEKTNNWTGREAPLGGFSWKSSMDETGHPLQEIQMGPFATMVSNTLKDIVVTMIKNGHYVIIDDISLTKEEVENWQNLLKNFNTLYIGLKAPLELLEEREKARGDRIIGSARDQFNKIHKDVCYDLEFDVSKTSHSQIIEKIKCWKHTLNTN